MLLLFIGTGLIFTLRCGFFQVNRIGLWMSKTFLSCFKNRKVHTSSDEHSISRFQALCASLAASLGTGNIAGVATAIVAGGPGAVFYMCLSAFLGMMTCFAENVLGILYRSRSSDGRWIGGPMYYMEKGVHSKAMAVFFAFSCILASLGMGNMSQANSVSAAMEHSFSIPAIVSALVLTVVVALVLIGGIKRIATVTEKLIPALSAAYILGALVIITVNIKDLPSALYEILYDALNFRAASAGMLGYSITMAIRYGVSRGVFSNEAGLGSSVLIHTESDIKEPVEQGMWGIFEVFADTIVICLLTAVVIIITGVNDASTADGVVLTAEAFASVFSDHGSDFVSVSIVLFAFATIIGWSVYGGKCAEYIFGRKAVRYYIIVYIIAICVGSLTSMKIIWEISDIFNGLMALPNLIALLLLQGEVVREYRRYINKKS